MQQAMNKRIIEASDYQDPVHRQLCPVSTDFLFPSKSNPYTRNDASVQYPRVFIRKAPD